MDTTEQGSIPCWLLPWCFLLSTSAGWGQSEGPYRHTWGCSFLMAFWDCLCLFSPGLWGDMAILGRWAGRHEGEHYAGVSRLLMAPLGQVT